MLNLFNKNAYTSNFMKTLKIVIQPNCGKKQTTNTTTPATHTKRPARPPIKFKFVNKKMQRFWEEREPGLEHHLKEGGKQFKLLSYNILAQDLLVEHLHLYADIEPQLLRWDHRLRRLKAEILQLNPDILCLQEMQYNHLKGLVNKIMGNRKLEYLFKKKTGHRSDGCAIIYDKSKFKLIEERGIEYYTSGVATLNRENVALLAKFQLRDEPYNRFVVATTHLLYNPKRHDVRVAQVEILLRALNDFASERHNETDAKNNDANVAHMTRLPVILTGDFNFEPFSPPHALLTKSSHDHHESPTKLSKLDRLQMCPLNFGNTCASTLQDRWIVVDYILHSAHQKKLKIWSVYKLPTIRECTECGKIPNRQLGSDHFSLAIAFSIV